jgi:hypothetical protein
MLDLYIAKFNRFAILLVSLVVLATIGLQVVVSLPHEMINDLRVALRGDQSSAWPQLSECTICSVGLWPFLDYPMYSTVYFEGEELTRYAVIGTLEDSTEVQILPEDLGQGYTYFRNHALKGLSNSDNTRIANVVEAYYQVNGRMLHGLRLENHPWILARGGMRDGNPEILTSVDILTHGRNLDEGIQVVPHLSSLIEDFEDTADLEISTGGEAVVSSSQVEGMVGRGYRVDFDGGQWWNLTKDLSRSELTSYPAISLTLKGSGYVRLQLNGRERPDGSDGEQWSVSIELPEEWQTLTYMSSDFTSESNILKGNKPLKFSSIESLQLKHHGKAPKGYFVIDQLGMVGDRPSDIGLISVPGSEIP